MVRGNWPIKMATVSRSLPFSLTSSISVTLPRSACHSRLPIRLLAGFLATRMA